MSRYYIDCEFDGHNGPLLSVAVIGPDDSIHIEVIAQAKDPWVAENVIPHLSDHQASYEVCCTEWSVGAEIIEFFYDRLSGATIIADSAVDVARFCRAITTDPDGNWNSIVGDMAFEVHDVAAYPTDLPGAVQHNAWWDAMALKHKLEGQAA